MQYGLNVPIAILHVVCLQSCKRTTTPTKKGEIIAVNDSMTIDFAVATGKLGRQDGYRGRKTKRDDAEEASEAREEMEREDSKNK